MTDIFIDKGVISEVGSDIDYELEGVELEVIDASGKLWSPAWWTMHCHLREPGFEYKETIETGTASAAMGGFTSIACMPNTKPVIDNAAVVTYIIERARESAACMFIPSEQLRKGRRARNWPKSGR